MLFALLKLLIYTFHVPNVFNPVSDSVKNFLLEFRFLP